MSDPLTNPYTAPQPPIISSDPQAGNLASPWIRLGAQVIDFIIMFFFQYLFLRMFFSPSQASLEEAMRNGGVEALVKASTPSFFVMLLCSLLAVAVLIGINWKFLPNGQTIGKKLLKIQIQARDGNLFPVQTLITKRMAPLYIAASIPYIGGLLVLIDGLCIFRPGLNTLHDDIAGSKVVRI